LIFFIDLIVLNKLTFGQNIPVHRFDFDVIGEEPGLQAGNGGSLPAFLMGF